MVKAQKVESLGTSVEVRDPGLLRMQPQPESAQDHRRLLARLFSTSASGAEDDEVVGISDQRPEPLPAIGPRLIENV